MDVYGRDFAAAYNAMWAFWGPKMWPFLSAQIARRCPRARTWLDLCCGTGSLLKLACAHGYEAVGLDRSPHQLRYARKNAPKARLVEADIRSFRLRRRFDVVTCLFDSLNYVTDLGEVERVFRNVARHLAARGLFAFDVNTPEGHGQYWRGTWIRHGKDFTIAGESFTSTLTQLAHLRLTGFVRRGTLYRKFEESHVQRGYSREEMDDLLARTGFAFARYNGNALDRRIARATRLLYVCWKA
ncbi:MAG: class I SAM-dependent methyltransferase [Planctomycetes bacterium]|nr:class I SAM-dependent methyltransferase [Planctomycetota bacterium]